MGQDFNARHGCITLHGNEVQKQFALGIRPLIREFANDHINLARLADRIEAFEKRIAIAEDIEDMGDRRLILAGVG